MAQHGTRARESRYWAVSASDPRKPERSGNASDRTRERRIGWDPRVGTVGNSDALNGEKFRGSIQTLECPPAARRKNRRLAYTDWCQVDAGIRETHSGKNVETGTKNVGAWCWIGGGQGALSQARKETGVACRPSKQLDHSSSARESNVVRLMSELPNRKMEADSNGDGENRGKWSPKVATKRVFSNERARWMWEPGAG